MGRLIIYDNIVQENLNAVLKDKNAQSGLIIGQCIDQKDIVIRLCPTPKKDEDLSSESGPKDPKRGKKSKQEEYEFDEHWIVQHAKQLMRALPGGLDILGLYVAAPSDHSIKQQAQLRQILFAVYKTLGKNRKLILGSNERILLSICPVTTKFVCRTYDIADSKCSANPAEFKLQSGNLKWLRVRCQLAVEIKFPIKRDDAHLSFQKQIQTGLHSFLQNCEDAYALVNGAQRDSDEYLDLSADKKRSKKKQTSEKEDLSSSDWHDVELFLPLESSQNDQSSDPEVVDSVCMMTFKGSAQCRAYVHGKATVGEAIDALKQDVVRSVLTRCEIHCEDLLLIDEEQQDPLVVHELPRRVFALLPQDVISVCDYQFHSDTASDSLDAFKELLNLDLTEADIDMSCEVSPTTSTLILPDVMEDRLSEFGDAPTHSSRGLYVPIAGFVATIAVGVASYLITSQSS